MKVLVIGDSHFGEKGNSEKFNQQVQEFSVWVTQFAGKVDMVVHLGDYFHDRSKISVLTLNYGINTAKRLSEAFGRENLHILAGNHDCFYKDRIDVHSLASIEPYLTVVNEITVIDNMVLCPWIVNGEMWDKTISLGKDHDYLFAHLELNGFKVNDAYTMEHGFSHKELRDYKKVISGHYHSSQKKDNIIYAGTPFPITMNEANEEHGVYIVDTESGDIEFIKYDRINVVSIPYSRIDEISNYDPKNTSIRIEFPDDLEDESVIDEVRQMLVEKEFSDHKIKFKSQKVQRLLEANIDQVEEVENIDDFVLKYLNNATKVEGIDMTMMDTLYRQAIEKSKEAV